MSIERWVTVAREAGASDLHLEPGAPMTLRVRGALRMVGEPLAPAVRTGEARALLDEDGWNAFLTQRSADLARTISGVRCRINVLQSLRGVGLVVRLLSPFQATLRKLNLHPALRKLVEPRHGLILVSGPTGSGKSTTLAALIHEIDLAAARHIVTIESPVEYVLAPKQSLIRQREVGRHTPSVAQALVDALREDPDVLMVGELRDPESMRLTLNAAETGHLVLTTLHSSNCAEALQRLVGAFPPEVQAGICAQLADCLVGVVCQRLRFRPAQKMLVPECEILMPSTGSRAVIRQGQFFKLASALEGGGQEGSWSFARYSEWLDAKTDWAAPSERAAEPTAAVPEAPSPLPPLRAKGAVPKNRPSATTDDGVMVIEDAEDLEEVLAEMDRGRH